MGISDIDEPGAMQDLHEKDGWSLPQLIAVA
jgi:hypothetical protein